MKARFTCFIYTLAALGGLAAAAHGAPLSRDLWVMDDESGQIFAVSPGGGAKPFITEAQITALTGFGAARFTDNGMAYDQATGRLFFTESNSDHIFVRHSDGTLDILTDAIDIDIAVGADGITEFSSAEKIAYSNGFLYVTDFFSNSLLKVDAATGAVSVLTGQADYEAVLDVYFPANAGNMAHMEAGIAVSPDGSTVYVANNGDVTGGFPNAIISVDAVSGTPTVLVDDSSFDRINKFMALAPNGDIIVADENLLSGTGGLDELFRVTPLGVVSSFLTNDNLLAALSTNPDAGTAIPDLDGGFAFDDFGNFFFAEENTDSIYKWSVADLGLGTIDPLSGTLFLGELAAEAALGIADLDLEGGIVFGAPVPEPSTLLLLGTGLVGLVALRRKRC